MAKLILDDVQLTSSNVQSWAKVIGLGAAVGLAYWLLTLILGRYVVEPFACRNLIEAASCVDAVPIAGKIATVLVAVFAIAGMVRLGVFRPLVIAVAAAALLWELPAYTEGLFWLESLAWSILLYAGVYALFGWIARQSSLLLAIILSAIIVIVMRIALIL